MPKAVKGKARPARKAAARRPAAERVAEIFARFAAANPEPKGELEHINPYTRRELRRELERMGLTVLDVQYVGGSEMIFKAFKPKSAKAQRPALRIAGP